MTAPTTGHTPDAKTEPLAYLRLISRDLRAFGHIGLANETLDAIGVVSAERDRLREVNAELLAALKRLLTAYRADVEIRPEMAVSISYETNSMAVAFAQDAIAKAEQA